MDVLSQINDLFDEIPSSPVEEEVKESIDVKKAPMGKVVKDFYKSDAPQFKGKSKKKKQEMAVAAKLQSENQKFNTYEERLMGTVVNQISTHSRPHGELKEVPQLDEERFKNLEIQLLQVKQLFHEATMVSGIGQGGDGQTPGSGEVKLARLDDVSTDNLQDGNSLIWDSTSGKFVPGAAGGGTGPAVDRLVAGVGIDLDPPGGIGIVQITLDANLNDLNDVTGVPTTTGDLLVWSGTSWAIGTIGTSQVQLTNPQNIPYYGGLTGPMTTQEDANHAFSELIESLDSRVDTLETATTPGTFLGLIDCTQAANEPDTATLNKGDYYIHQGASGALWNVGDNVDDGNQVIWNGTAWNITGTVTSLSQLGDTDVDSPQTGEFLVYDEADDKWHNEAVNIPLVTVDTIEPNTGNEKDGDFWFDSANEILYIYSTVWTKAGGGGSVAIAGSPPAGAASGDMYVDTDQWVLYVFDGTSSTWVGLTNNGLSSSSANVVTGDELKSIAASATDFADFQAKIAAFDF